MIYRGKYCDLHITGYEIGGHKNWMYNIYNKGETLIGVKTGFKSKNSAKAEGRRVFRNREEELRLEYIKALVPAEVLAEEGEEIKQLEVTKIVDDPELVW